MMGRIPRQSAVWASMLACSSLIHSTSSAPASRTCLLSSLRSTCESTRQPLGVEGDHIRWGASFINVFLAAMVRRMVRVSCTAGLSQVLSFMMKIASASEIKQCWRPSLKLIGLNPSHL